MSQAGRRSAILIGSSQFDREPLKAKPLQCPERDVDGMHTLLSAEEFGAFDETFVFKNVHHQVALDQIDEVLSTAARDDQVLIYFSGHGKTDLPGRLYLTTANTDTRRLVTTSIPIETLRTMIELSACKKIILILDCCFGGAAGKSFVKGSVDEKLKELARGYGVYILTASTAAQTAQDGEGDGYSLLTKHIITGIKDGAAASDDGLISMDGLYRYVYAQVTGEGYQEPMRWALNVKGEDLIIARSGKKPARERQRLLTEVFIEIRNHLPPSLFAKVIQVIQERRAPFYELVEEFGRSRLTVGEFIEEWYRLESVELQPQPLPQRTEIKPISSERAKPPVATEPLASPPPSKPSSDGVQSPGGFSRKRPATTQSADADAPSTVTPKLQPALVRPRMLSRRAWLTGSVIGMPIIAFLIYLGGHKSPPTALTDPSPTPASSPNNDPSPTPASSPNNATNPSGDFSENLNGIKLEMVRVPRGTYKMGSPEGSGSNEEHPQHDVTVPGFQIGKFEVTQAQWKAVMGDSNNPSSYKGDKLPVENVSWNEAKVFCETLSGMTGKNYRLPSEAEWEYACRAGNTGDYAGELQEMAWYSLNSGNITHAVGRKMKNVFGLFDMHGNVWEWCEDVWHADYNGAPVNGSAWINGGDQRLRVIRGGEQGSDADNCRSAKRNYGTPDTRQKGIGFRVVVSASPLQINSRQK